MQIEGMNGSLCEGKSFGGSAGEEEVGQEADWGGAEPGEDGWVGWGG